MTLTIQEGNGGVFQVVEDRKVHASFTFSTMSAASRAQAKAKAEGFKQGVLYALAFMKD